MKKSMLALLFGSALVLAACGGDDSDSANSTKPEGEKLVMQSCATCHGGNLQGTGNTPDLNKVGSRLSEAEILDIIENGKGKGMPPGLLKGEDAEKAAAWLAEQK
jgi:cytochrome c551